MRTSSTMTTTGLGNAFSTLTMTNVHLFVCCLLCLQSTVVFGFVVISTTTTTTTTPPRRSYNNRNIILPAASTEESASFTLTAAIASSTRNGINNKMVVPPPAGQQERRPPDETPMIMTTSTSTTNKTFPTSKKQPAAGGVSSSSSSSSSAPPAKRQLLLSDTEHDQCLQHVLELRRIRTVLKQHHQLPSTSTDGGSTGVTATGGGLLLHKSQLCGYGDEIDVYVQAVTNGERSREWLITHHLGLVRFVVHDVTKRRTLYSITRDDLIQEGVLGLARALDKYDPTRNTKLSTYSVFWIRAVVLRAIAEKDSPVYVPHHIQQTAARIQQRRRRDTNQYWHEAYEAKQLAESLGVSDRHLREALKVQQRRFLSYETMIQQHGETTSWMEDQQQQQMENGGGGGGVDLHYLKEALSVFLGPREVEALSWRYGLNNIEPTTTTNTVVDASNNNNHNSHHHHHPRTIAAPAPATTVIVNSGTTNGGGGGRGGEAMSFHEVGAQMHVSAEYCRRLVHRALKKLHQAVAEGSLELAALMP